MEQQMAGYRQTVTNHENQLAEEARNVDQRVAQSAVAMERLTIGESRE